MRIPVKYIIYPDGTDAEKPCYYYRSKQEANPVRAKMLKGKQAYQYDACNREFYICKVLTFKGKKHKRGVH